MRALFQSDFPAEPQQCWDHSYCPHRHGQQSNPETEAEAEAEAERTEADGADGGVKDVGEAEEFEDLNKDEVTEAAFVMTTDQEAGAECNSAADNEENSYETEEGGEGRLDLGVPEEDLAGVLEELELTMKMTSMNQQKIEDLTRPADTTTAPTHVRRRNRKRAKRDLH